MSDEFDFPRFAPMVIRVTAASTALGVDIDKLRLSSNAAAKMALSPYIHPI